MGHSIMFDALDALVVVYPEYNCSAWVGISMTTTDSLLINFYIGTVWSMQWVESLKMHQHHFFRGT